MISTIISIVLLYSAYAYLKTLKTCKCANDLYATRLKKLESILLGLNIFILLFAILGSFKILNILGTFKKHFLKIAMLGGITMLIYSLFFIYNGYEFWRTLPVTCACADKWQKYYIYFQTIVYFLIVLLTTLFAGAVAFQKITLPSSGSIVPDTPSKIASKSKKSKKRT